MDPTALKFIEKERVCVISVVLADGSPHSAVVHYSYEPEPLRLFIQTYPTTKVQAVSEQGGSAKAALVIGFDEKEFVTLQMRGFVRIVSDQKSLDHIYKVHYAKHPDTEKYKGPSTVFFEFTPTWWRYSDFSADPEKTVEGELPQERN